MNVDISNLSYEELTALQKTIEAQKKAIRNGGEVSKTAITYKLHGEGFFDLVKKQYEDCNFEKVNFADGSVSNEVLDHYFEFEKCFLKVCDAITQNTTVKETGKNTKRLRIFRNSTIRPDISKKYCDLADELIAVMKKYID